MLDKTEFLDEIQMREHFSKALYFYGIVLIRGIVLM